MCCNEQAVFFNLVLMVCWNLYMPGDELVRFLDFDWLSERFGCSTFEWVEENASKLHTQQVPPEALFPLLTFFHLCYLFIYWPMFPAAFPVSWSWSYFVCSGLTLGNIQWKWSLYIRILHGLLSCDSSPCVRIVVISLHMVTILMMIRNAQWTMIIIYSLKLFVSLSSSIQ